MSDEINAVTVNANKLHIVQEPLIHRVMTLPAEPDTVEKVREISEALLVTVNFGGLDRPDDVAAKIVLTLMALFLQLRVHSVDIGKVIGKQGRMAGALRSLLGAMNATAKLTSVLTSSINSGI